MCASQGELGGAGTTVDLSKGDWGDVRCRVEEGFAQRSEVLEDGAIQVGGPLGSSAPPRDPENTL